MNMMPNKPSNKVEEMKEKFLQSSGLKGKIGEIVRDEMGRLKEIKDEFRAEAGQETFCEDVEIIALRKIELAFNQGCKIEKSKIGRLINSVKSDTEKIALVVEYLNVDYKSPLRHSPVTKAL